MLLTLGSFLLAPLVVFGVYQLLTWFNVFRINSRVFWKRVAITSAVCHVLLVSGFFIFFRLDAGDAAFGVYLFDRSNFWKLISIFDTASMLVLVTLFSVLDRAGINPPGLVAWTIVITYVVGTLQWFLVGGGIGALLERFFEGLRTPDPEDEDWF
jgi:hypothetical protein